MNIYILLITASIYTTNTYSFEFLQKAKRDLKEICENSDLSKDMKEDLMLTYLGIDKDHIWPMMSKKRRAIEVCYRNKIQSLSTKKTVTSEPIVPELGLESYIKNPPCLKRKTSL